MAGEFCFASCGILRLLQAEVLWRLLDSTEANACDLRQRGCLYQMSYLLNAAAAAVARGKAVRHKA